MKKLAILGASGHGRVVADTARQCGWNEIAFFDDAWPELNTNEQSLVIGDTASLLQCINEFDGVVVGIGNNRLRLEKTILLRDAGLPIISLIHPAAYVAETVDIEVGTVVFAGAVVQTSTSIGFAVVVNTGATVDHDCVLSAGVHVCPGVHLAGTVEVGECAWIGIGAVANQNLKIGKDVTIGAGAAVIANVPNNVTIVGVPGRVVKKD